MFPVFIECERIFSSLKKLQRTVEDFLSSLLFVVEIQNLCLYLI